MPGHVFQRFENWGEDHVQVYRIRGHVTMEGIPIFMGLDYGRWMLIDDKLATFTYYPPFAHKGDKSETHIVVRSESPIESLPFGDEQQITYDEWNERYPDCTDLHLTTVVLKGKSSYGATETQDFETEL